MTRDATTALYDSLARWQWWRRRLRRAAAGDGLEMRKRLRAPRGEAPVDGPQDGSGGLDRWLQRHLGGRAHDQLLDLGCGFGASIQRWLAYGCRHAIGITPSGYQVRRAQQVAQALGSGARSEFRCQRIEAPLPGDQDVVLAIEALGHTHDLPSVLSNVRRALRPSGVFLWVEDLLREPMPDEVDVKRLCASWSSPPLRDVATIDRQLAAAGLRTIEEIDLTDQVPHRAPDAIDRSQRRLERLLPLFLPLPFTRRIAHAFAGGFALERLYARGAACYRFVMAQPVPETS